MRHKYLKHNSREWHDHSSTRITSKHTYRLGIPFPNPKISHEVHRVDANFQRPHGSAWEQDELGGIYVISVAARILDMHPQTLRKYERVGLVQPSRTVGMLRLYSEEDIVRLQLIKHLVVELGLNLAGVRLALGIFNQLLHMRHGMNRLENGALRAFLQDRLIETFEMLQSKTI